jgi:hypothetical protein
MRKSVVQYRFICANIGFFIHIAYENLLRPTFSSVLTFENHVMLPPGSTSGRRGAKRNEN